MGFEFADVKKILDDFKATYFESDTKYDLDKWHDYENVNPNVFAGMYQFWTQKT